MKKDLGERGELMMELIYISNQSNGIQHFGCLWSQETYGDILKSFPHVLEERTPQRGEGVGDKGEFSGVRGLTSVRPMGYTFRRQETTWRQLGDIVSCQVYGTMETCGDIPL
jgi:hypothetical protein